MMIVEYNRLKRSRLQILGSSKVEVWDELQPTLTPYRNHIHCPSELSILGESAVHKRVAAWSPTAYHNTNQSPANTACTRCSRASRATCLLLSLVSQHSPVGILFPSVAYSRLGVFSEGLASLLRTTRTLVTGKWEPGNTRVPSTAQPQHD